MPTILSIQKNEIALKPEDFLETARYLGYNKANPLDEQVMGMIKAACKELFGKEGIFKIRDITIDGFWFYVESFNTFKSVSDICCVC